MTFPANYAVIAEDELTYVVGGGVIADVLPAVMTAENWKTFSTNVVKIVGNGFVNSFVQTVLGTMFGGSYEFGRVASTIGGSKTIWAGMNGLNKFMQVLGGLSAIYTLGTTTSGKDGDSITAKLPSSI